VDSNHRIIEPKSIAFPLGYLSIQSPGIHTNNVGCTGLPFRDKSKGDLNSNVNTIHGLQSLKISGQKKTQWNDQSGFTKKIPERPFNAFQDF
jgi:hypothetical protein